jgi:hypothetical protein
MFKSGGLGATGHTVKPNRRSVIARSFPEFAL